jgi:hypothetical protein
MKKRALGVVGRKRDPRRDLAEIAGEKADGADVAMTWRKRSVLRMHRRDSAVSVRATSRPHIDVVWVATSMLALIAWKLVPTLCASKTLPCKMNL